MTYRDRCQMNDCDVRFIGVTRSEYIEHLREAHGSLVAKIHDQMVVQTCEPCGVTYISESGYCPACHEADGSIEGELPERAQL